MSKRNSNFQYNYPILINWLRLHGIPYCEYGGGQHLKILGATAAIELWPAQMTFHVLESESTRELETDQGRYYRYSRLLDKRINIQQLEEILNGWQKDNQ